MRDLFDPEFVRRFDEHYASLPKDGSLPKSILRAVKNHPAFKDGHIDLPFEFGASTFYYIDLAPGWCSEDEGNHQISQPDNVRKLLKAFRAAKPCACEECRSADVLERYEAKFGESLPLACWQRSSVQIACMMEEAIARGRAISTEELRHAQGLNVPAGPIDDDPGPRI